MCELDELQSAGCGYARLMHSRHWLAIVVAALGWGSGGVATRATLAEGVGVWTIIALRVALAALIVLTILVLRRSRLPTAVVTRYGLNQAVFNLSIPFILFTFAVREVSAGFVGILTALIPIATLLFASYMIPDESVTPSRFIALLFGFSGVVTLILMGDSGLAEGGRPLLAACLALVAVISVSYAGTFAKKHAGSYDTIVLSGIQFGSASIWLVIAMFAVEGPPIGVTQVGWLLILWLAAVSTVMPFFIFFWLLRHIPVTNASLVGYMVPFVALVGGIVFLDEKLQLGLVIGGVLVIIGMFLSDRETRRMSVLSNR